MENPFLGLKKFETNTRAYISRIQLGPRWISFHETVLVLRSSLRELKSFPSIRGGAAKLLLENDSSKKKKTQNHTKATAENKAAATQRAGD